MTVEFDNKLTNKHEKFTRLSEIQDQSINNKKELVLIDFDHMVLSRVQEDMIEHLVVTLE